ncbi:uncharacterized protein [Struthio camelus]|uniref:uncharacterized protein isoform X3 n=1 Tax=Struthio camelus TaxID=8801 RepID=UPI003603B2EE
MSSALLLTSKKSLTDYPSCLVSVTISVLDLRRSSWPFCQALMPPFFKTSPTPRPALPTSLYTSTEHQESDNLVAKFLLLTIRYLLAGSTRRTPGSFLLQLLSKAMKKFCPAGWIKQVSRNSSTLYEKTGEGKLSPPQLVSLTLQSSAFNEEEEMCQILAKLHNNPTEEIHQYSDQFNREAAQTKAATKENTYNTSSQLFSQSVPMPVRKT